MKQTFRDFAYSAFHLACRGDGEIGQTEVRTVLTSLAHLGDTWDMRPTKAMEAAIAVSQEYLHDRDGKSQEELDAILNTRLASLGDVLDAATLQHLYEELKLVAASDGKLAVSEKRLLQRVREAWKLPNAA